MRRRTSGETGVRLALSDRLTTVRTPSLLWVLSSRAWRYEVSEWWLVVLAKVIGSGRDVSCSPRTLAAASGAGWRAQSPLDLLGFSFGVFPLLSSERGFLYSHGQTAIRKR